MNAYSFSRVHKEIGVTLFQNFYRGAGGVSEHRPLVLPRRGGGSTGLRRHPPPHVRARAGLVEGRSKIPYHIPKRMMGWSWWALSKFWEWLDTAFLICGNKNNLFSSVPPSDFSKIPSGKLQVRAGPRRPAPGSPEEVAARECIMITDPFRSRRSEPATLRPS